MSLRAFRHFGSTPRHWRLEPAAMLSHGKGAALELQGWAAYYCVFLVITGVVLLRARDRRKEHPLFLSHHPLEPARQEGVGKGFRSQNEASR